MRWTFPWTCACLLVGLLGFGCKSGRPGTEPADGTRSVMSTELGRLRGVTVVGAIWIAPVPGREELELARRRGIVTLLDLCTDAETATEVLRQACLDNAIEYVGVRPSQGEIVSDALVDRVLGEILRYQERPLLIVSGSGSRAAMLFAVHRVVHDGLPLEQALVEARRSGMKPGHPEVFVRRQAERLAAPR